MKKFYYFAIGLMACLASSCEQNVPATSKRVETGALESLTTTSVVLHGSVNVDLLAYESVEYGMMISTKIEEMNQRNGREIAVQYIIGTELTLALSDLEPNTKYYYCTWLLLNDQQYEYGSIESFTTPDPIEGIGVFSVSDSQKISFSPGNLQYLPNAKVWKFAETQYSYIGENNTLTDSLYDNYIDLFCWGTGAQPIYDSIIIDFIDWGSNVIELEGANTWRTLTSSEWEYIISKRENADSLVTIAQVNGVNGLLLLPDNWKKPQGIMLKAGFSQTWNKESYAAQQTFTTNELKKLEETGVVFLPAAGYVSNMYLIDEQYFGQYWSSSSNDKNAPTFKFYSGGCSIEDHSKSSRRSVRLVKNCK